MRNNPVWNLIIKSSSFLAIIFSLVGAAMVCASYLGGAQIQAAAVLPVALAAVLGVFSLVALNLSEIKLKSERAQAIEIAARLAQGESFDEAAGDDTELLAALREISDYRQRKTEVLNKIATGDLSENVVLHSDFDVTGQAVQNMIDKLRLLVQTQDERDRLEKSILKLSEEVAEVAAGDLTVQA